RSTSGSPAERCKRRWRKSTRDTWPDPRSAFSELRSSRWSLHRYRSIDDGHHINMQKNLGLCGIPLHTCLKGCRIERPGLFEKVIADLAIRHGLCNHHGPRHPRHEEACAIKAGFLIVTRKKCRNPLEPLIQGAHVVISHGSRLTR